MVFFLQVTWDIGWTSPLVTGFPQLVTISSIVAVLGSQWHLSSTSNINSNKNMPEFELMQFLATKIICSFFEKKSFSPYNWPVTSPRFFRFWSGLGLVSIISSVSVTFRRIVAIVAIAIPGTPFWRRSRTAFQTSDLYKQIFKNNVDSRIKNLKTTSNMISNFIYNVLKRIFDHSDLDFHGFSNGGLCMTLYHIILYPSVPFRWAFGRSLERWFR